MDKVKNFILRYKVTLTMVLLLGISLTAYFIASANEDPYENKIEVKTSNVTIEDGTANVDGNFDANDEPGNDSSDSNHIVRNFDSIIYNIEYTLGFKDDNDEESTDTTRNIIIDVLVPSNLNAQVTSELSSSPEGYVPEELEINGTKYNYYTLEYKNSSMINSNTANVVLSNINSTNNTEILPIIRIREKTDNNFSDITSDTALESITNVLTDSDKVKVSAVDKIAVKLYPGTIKNDKSTGITAIPIGIVLYIPRDENRGIKGVQVPSSTSYDMHIKYIEGDGNISYLDKGDYDENKFNVKNLPNSYKNGKNANIGYEEITTIEGDKKTYKLNFENINYNTDTTNIGTNEKEEFVSYVSSNVFAVNSEKLSNKDALIQFEMNNDTVQVLDNYVEFVGDYSTKIDFINSSNITTTIDKDVTFETPGEAKYNYNEEFYIQNTITYAEKSGDVLKKGLTNYIKIDNSMIRLLDVGNLSDETLDYYINVSSSNEKQNTDLTTEGLYKVSYGVGEWNIANFKIKDGAPSFCPKNLSKLTKDELMNYYGGPCIEEIDGKVKWYDSIATLAEEDENNRNKIILFKYQFNQEYYPATKTIIRLKAKAVNNISNIGKTTQIVSRGTTIDDNKIYYLSGVSRKSVADLKADLYYTKTEYNSLHEKVDNTNIPNNEYGNTILITPFKVTLSDIEVRDKNDSKKNTIYSGFTDPISIKISPILKKSDPNATFKNATLHIYLPSELELTYEQGDLELTYVGNKVINDINYNEYKYTYTEDDIKYGNASVVDSLQLHAYIGIAVSDDTLANVRATIDAILKPNIDATTEFGTYTTEESRSKNVNILLKNTNVINTIGKMSSSTYFEKNGEMIYNMRAANISGEEKSLSLIKVIPYSGDSVGEGSEFDGNISVRLAETLPAGYEAYYTKENSKTLLNKELSSSNSNNWTKWTNYTNNVSGISAIKIVAVNKIPNNGYFAGNGINLIMKTSGNKEGDEYYNNFYILSTTKNTCTEEEKDCNGDKNITTPVASNISYASVYNREISGYAFEDYDYNGYYSTSEKRLNDVAVSIYKVKSSDGKVNLENDELLGDSITDKNGYYKFKGLSQGNYYIKYTYDCDKYTVTEQNKVDENIGDTSDIDSDASMISGTCDAISRVVTLDNKNVKQSHIDIGLRIRQNFGVNIKKYITNVVVNSNRGTSSYDYDKQTKVKIDVKNLKNTTFRVTYKFEIENSKYFPGTIGTIIETIPDGMTFDNKLAANDGWYLNGNNLYYSKLAGTLILPGEKYYMTIVLDLKTDNGGTYVNFVSAQDLKVMDTSVNLLEGIEIKDKNGNTINRKLNNSGE